MTEAGVPFPKTLEERYKKPRFIGKGAASTVYAALDTRLNREVAIKILPPGASGQKLLRFQQEAKVIGKLTHPNIVQAIDFGVVDEKVAYLVLDLVGDKSLLSLIERRERISIGRAIEIFKQVATGMAHAHSQGVLHRDLKPGNVLLDDPSSEHPRAKIADFGVAKIAGTPFLVTTGNIFIGTPAYTSPEQFRAEEVDERSDIYSFGCLMFETLTGAPPFSATNTAEMAMRHANDPVPPLQTTSYDEEIPNALIEIVKKCLEKQAENRFSSFSDLVEALSSIRIRDAEQDEEESAEEDDNLAPKEPYLVSTISPGYHSSAESTGGSMPVIVLITGLVLTVGCVICASLMGFAPDLASLFSNEKQTEQAATKDGAQQVSPTQKPLDGADESTSKDAVASRGSIPAKEIKLPAALLKGTTKELLDKARENLGRKRYTLAAGFCTAVLERNPENESALKIRSDARKELNNLSGALTDISQAIDVRPDDKKNHFKRAILRRSVGDINGALDDMNVLLQAHPENGRFWRERGRIQEALGRRTEALVDFSKAITLSPDDESNYRARARIYHASGSFQKSLADLDKSIKLKPERAESYFFRGSSYVEMKRYKSAIEDFSTAIKLDPNNPAYYGMRAHCYELVGKKGLATLDRNRQQKLE